MLERPSKIDPLTLGDHYYLREGDDCFYYGEYTARRGYRYSDTNQLIHNLKKSVTQRAQPHYRHKGGAIERIAQALANQINHDPVTYVPVPPSKASTHPEYDDRMVKILSRCQQLKPNLDYRELVIQTETTEAAHTTTTRPRPQDLETIYAINPAATATPLRRTVVILDDMLTTGCHFIAMRNVIQQAFPGQRVVGLFVARRVPEAEDVEDVFADLTI